MTINQLSDLGFTHLGGRVFYNDMYSITSKIPQNYTFGDLLALIYDHGLENGRTLGREELADNLRKLIGITTTP